MKVALAIRGHIRDGLTDAGLREYIVKLSGARYISQLDIYCHSWKEHEAKSSYRELDNEVKLKVTSELIRHYFGKDIRSHVKSVEIQDDTKVELVGNTEGFIGKTKMPVLAWKRMWAGKKKLIDTICDSGIAYDRIINTRYDLFTLKASKADESMLNRLVRGQYSLNFKYPLYTRGAVGVDNFYTGNCGQIKQLTHAFHNNLDDIMKRYSNIDVQERMVCDYANEAGLITR